MTNQERKNQNGIVDNNRDDFPAFAQKLHMDTFCSKVECQELPQTKRHLLEIHNDAMQAEADLASDIVNFKKLAERLKGGSY